MSLTLLSPALRRALIATIAIPCLATTLAAQAASVSPQAVLLTDQNRVWSIIKPLSITQISTYMCRK